jgi:excisionase family DNA binding protein
MQSYARVQPPSRVGSLHPFSSIQLAPTPEALTGAATDGALLEQLLGRIADLVVDRMVERTGLNADQATDDWMDARAAADYLGVHRDTLRKLAAERAVPVHQDGPGCKLYFNRDELDDWRRTGRPIRRGLRAVA